MPYRVVVALDIGVLLCLSGLDVLDDDRLFPSPFQQLATDVFRAVAIFPFLTKCGGRPHANNIIFFELITFAAWRALTIGRDPQASTMTMQNTGLNPAFSEGESLDYTSNGKTQNFVPLSKNAMEIQRGLVV